MTKIAELSQSRVFYYFEKISEIPRGSGDMTKIADYCENFAKEHNLKYIRDNADNLVIYKPGTAGYEASEPVILQGHLDMVCQKTPESKINFEKDGLDLYVDGDFLKAQGTTLGADNGIAVSMILAIIDSESYEHPPIEAVFTVDEEIGMLGAMALDKSVLKSKRMINIDSEDEGVVTVSCAGGGDLCAVLPINRKKAKGAEVTLAIKGLKGGHSGIEINGGRVNADILLGRVLDCLSEKCGFDIISVKGGDKSNAIPHSSEAKLCVADTQTFLCEAEECFNTIKKEIAAREADFSPEVSAGAVGEFDVLDDSSKGKLLYALMCVPCGVMEMSAEIEGLVETSLNLGIMQTQKDSISCVFSLRSNKHSAQMHLKRRLEVIFKALGAECENSGYYPAWEYKADSQLREVYCGVYEEICKKKSKVEAIHAGLECGVFSSAAEGMDAISIGPQMYDVHTTKERLSVSSTNGFFDVLTEILKRLK